MTVDEILSGLIDKLTDSYKRIDTYAMRRVENTASTEGKFYGSLLRTMDEAAIELRAALGKWRSGKL